MSGLLGSPGEEYQINLQTVGGGGCFPNLPTAKNPILRLLGTFETKMATCYSQPDDLTERQATVYSLI